MAVIYRIRNIRTDGFYIGSTINGSGRWKAHRSELNRGIHKNIHLQRAWIKYGSDAFLWEILEECEPEQLVEREQWLLDCCVGTPNCYNILRFAYAPGRNRIWTMKERARAAENGTGKIFTNERRVALSRSKMGHAVSDATKATLRSAMKNADCRRDKFSDDQKREMRELFATGRYTQKYLADLFNCSPTHFGRIVRNIPRSERH